MLFFLMEQPGRFSAWCEAVTARLAERALGPTPIIHANTLEELSLGAMRSSTSRAIVAARQPGGSLGRALVEAGRNFILALDDPGLVLADMVLGQEVELAAATQAVASSCGALIGYRSLPNALILHGLPLGRAPPLSPGGTALQRPTGSWRPARSGPISSIRRAADRCPSPGLATCFSAATGRENGLPGPSTLPVGLAA